MTIDEKHNIDNIINLASKKYGVDILETRNSQKAEHVRPRMLAIHTIKRVLNLPDRVIGGIFNKDHSTVINAIKTVNTRIEWEKGYIEKNADILNYKFQHIQDEKPVDLFEKISNLEERLKIIEEYLKI